MDGFMASPDKSIPTPAPPRKTMRWGERRWDREPVERLVWAIGNLSGLDPFRGRKELLAVPLGPL